MMLPFESSDHQTGGRRMGGDRRSFSYECCIPERRSGVERRSGKDRRRQSRMRAMMVVADETGAIGVKRSVNAMD
jgi:hypothetical protein